MTNSTDWNAEQHPRGHESNAGRFADKRHSEVESSVTEALTTEGARGAGLNALEGDPVALRPGEGATFYPNEWGGDLNDPVTAIDLFRDAHDGSLHLAAQTTLNFRDYLPERWTDAHKDRYIADHFESFAYVIAERYDGTISRDLSDNETQVVEFDVDIVGRKQVNLEQAYSIATEKTSLIRLYNESDHGTSGSENLGRILLAQADQDGPQRRFDLDVKAGSMQLAAEEVRREVEHKANMPMPADDDYSNSTELENETALRVARDFADNNPELTSLSQLAAGRLDGAAVTAELTQLHRQSSGQLERLKANALLTWVANGGPVRDENA